MEALFPQVRRRKWQQVGKNLPQSPYGGGRRLMMELRLGETLVKTSYDVSVPSKAVRGMNSIR